MSSLCISSLLEHATVWLLHVGRTGIKQGGRWSRRAIAEGAGDAVTTEGEGTHNCSRSFNIAKLLRLQN